MFTARLYPVSRECPQPVAFPRSQVLRGRVTEWVVKGLADNLQKHAQEFIQAAEDTADGVTIVVTLKNPPGFHELGEALKRWASLASLKIPAGDPTVELRIFPGHRRG